MFLSIIVPVYNVEAYLERCVGSLLDQDIDRSDYEIILVDDGSTDSSGTLCDRIASQEPGIRVIHKENGGLGSARNAGIRAAAAEYILFVDSDDYLEPCVLSGLRGQIEHDDTWKDKIAEASMTLSEKGDQLTWSRLWTAC